MIKEIKATDTRCFCGKTHANSIDEIKIGEGSLLELPDYLILNNFKKTVLICRDQDREKAAQVKRLLKQKKISVRILSVSDEKLKSEECFAGFLMMNLDSEVQCALLLGKGYELVFTRYVLSRLAIPAILLPITMPGAFCAAGLIPIYEKGIPRAVHAAEPVAVFADPAFMICTKQSVELGVMQTDNEALAALEWWLHSIMDDSYFCIYIEHQFEKNLRYVRKSMEDTNCSEQEKFMILLEFQLVISLLITYADTEALIFGSAFLMDAYRTRDKNHLLERTDKNIRISDNLLTYRMGKHAAHMIDRYAKRNIPVYDESLKQEIRERFGTQAESLIKALEASKSFTESSVLMRRKRSLKGMDQINRIREAFLTSDLDPRKRRRRSVADIEDMTSTQELLEAFRFAPVMKPCSNLLMLYRDFDAEDRLFG